MAVTPPPTLWVIAATDGSCRGNPGPAGWAWAIDREAWASGGLPKATNQVAELFAVLALLRAVPRDLPLFIQTDSEYTLKSITVWMKGWKSRGWRKADGQPVANLSLMKELDLALADRKAPTKFEWVRGHNGHRLNEVADKLCTAASAAVANGTDVRTGPGWNPVTLRPLPPPTVVRAKPRPTPAPARAQVKSTTNMRMCPACNAPINPLSMECRCSL